MSDNKDNQVSVVEDLEPEVLETVRIECPKCHAQIMADADKKNDIVCFCCERRIRVKERAGDMKTDVINETLCLPKGSVRALIAILLSATCWILVFKGEKVPNCLFSLLVAVISYYFAFRGGASLSDFSSRSRKKKDEFEDVTSSGKPKPLYLPSGFIRYFLIMGFVICAAIGRKKGFFYDYAFREFFIIFIGLVAGYFFAKLANTFRREPSIYNGITHIKGMLVVVAAFMIAVVILTGRDLQSLLTVCTCFVTFYFGSKS